MPRKGPESKRVYRDLVTLGSGGMAKVYKARQESLDRFVAIKELREDLARDPSIVARFEREAKYAAKLQHESIVHVYDFFKEEGSYYIVMEFVDGTDLGAIIKKQGAVPPEVAAIVALRLVRALEHAHRYGIIHRDIKPGNILLSKMGDLKLSDFGIAKEPEPEDLKADLTRTGQAIGTPSYMSPEQIVGDQLTFNSDLFSAGIVLYELLTGAKPFTSDTATSLLDKIRSQGYRDVRSASPSTPRKLAKIVRRCLRKEPRKRWTSTTHLRHALEDYVRRRVRISAEEYLREWLFDAGIFPREEKKPLAAATTRVVNEADAISRLRVWAPRAAIGGVALASIAAFAAGPAWLTDMIHGMTPETTPSPAATGKATPHASAAASSPIASATAAAVYTAAAAISSPTPIPSLFVDETPAVVVSDSTMRPGASHGGHGARASATIDAPVPTETPKPTHTPHATPAETASPTPTPHASATPHEHAASTPREHATATPASTPTPRKASTPRATATPRPSPSPTATPHHGSHGAKRRR